MAQNAVKLEASSGNAGGFRWELPHAGLVVDVQAEVLQQIARDYDSRGRLAWGFLLGMPPKEASGRRQLVINDTVELDGVPGDFTPHERLLAQTFQEARSFPAVGIYLRPESSDARAISDLILAVIGYMKAPLATVLVLRPEDSGAVMADLHLRIAGESLQNIHKATAPLPARVAAPPEERRAGSSRMYDTTPPRAHDPAPARTHDTAPPPIPPRPLPQMAPIGPPPVPDMYTPTPALTAWWKQPTAGIAAGALLVAAAAVLWNWRPESSTPGAATDAAVDGTRAATADRQFTSGKLDVFASRKGNDLEVTWNPASPALRGATRGFLFVTDGEERTQVFLEETHLQTGRLLYVPRTNDVDVRLEVMLPNGQIVRESLRVLGAGSRQRIAGDRLPSVPRMDDRPTVPPQSAAVPTTPAAPQESPAAPTEAAAEPRVQQPARAFTPPAQQSFPVGTARIERLPELAVGDAPGANPVPESVLLRSVPAPREESAPASTAPATATAKPASVPVQETQRPEPARAEPATGTPAPVQTSAPAPLPFHAAIPVQKVPVMLPTGVRTMITGEISTEVRVRIDERGRVVSAEVSREGSSLQRNIAELARNTALMWRFTPARRGERPVASDYSIVFKFRK